jgi:hypothetical protein
MTTGKPCMSDSDCQVNGGACINKCSTSIYTTNGSLYPTPVCLQPTCNPAPSSDPKGQYIHFCDGPDLSDSPGVCLPLTTPPTANMGICLPQCQYLNNGSAPVNPAGQTPACAGKDVCNPFAFGTTNQGEPIAIGYCFGGCTQTSDCPVGNECQVDEGICVKTTTTRTLSVGSACTSADGDPSTSNPNGTGHCSCNYDTQTLEGYCTSFCIVGAAAGTPGGCPISDAGLQFECDDMTPSFLQTSADGGVAWGTSMENTGMAGECLVKCTPTDAGGTGSAGCPNGGTADAGGGGDLCSSYYIGGPDCVPGAPY